MIDPTKTRYPDPPWITPFAYVDDDGALHLCCDRVVEAQGWPLTEENLRIAEKALTEMMEQIHPGQKIISNVEQHLRENQDKIVKE